VREDDDVTTEHDDDQEDSVLIVQRLFPSDGLDSIQGVVAMATAKFREALDAAGATVQEGASLNVRVVLGITPTMGAITVSAPVV
jgi:hypothetical protein